MDHCPIQNYTIIVEKIVIEYKKKIEFFFLHN